MTCKTLFSLASTLVLAGTVACADAPTSSPLFDADAELAALKDRTETLRSEATAVGASNPEVQAKLAELVADIQEWRARTGRNDVAVESSHPSEVQTETSFLVRGGGGSGCTAACPAVTREGNKYCFLESAGCTKGMTICVYTCITFGARAGLLATGGTTNGGVAP